ncbi:MAG TPA: hypothetical protein VMT24_02750 [Aggregatilineaceae bacterium]|nr:hypothetical protein [Aggregatilineaceae bacterium]
MTTIDELIERAYQKLGGENSTGARDDYRTLVLLAAPDEKILFNLLVAEDLDGLIFRQRLRLAHPDSLVVAIAEADYFARIGNYAQAVRLYTTLLESPSGSSDQAIDIRLKRLSALCRGGSTIRDCHQQILDDFWSLWGLGETFVPAQKTRRHWVRILMKELQSLEHASIFESLLLDERLPTSVRNLFSLKNSELNELFKVIEELRPELP